MGSIIKNLELRIAEDYEFTAEDVGRPIVDIKIPVEGAMLLQVTEKSGNIFEVNAVFRGTVHGHLILSLGSYFFFPKANLQCVLGEGYPESVPKEMMASLSNISIGQHFVEWLDENASLN